MSAFFLATDNSASHEKILILITNYTATSLYPMKRILIGALALSATTLPSVADTLGNIAFIGDSITQANGTNAVSYRYSLWKHFVDNGLSYNPVGSMSIFTSGSSNSDLAPNYLGQTFKNTSEGHFGWDVAWVVNGNSQGNRPNTGQGTGGLANWIENYTALPDTATILMGVNDLSRGSNGVATYSDEVIIENTKSVVETLQAANANITVNIFSILPSAQTSWNSGRVPSSGIPTYNEKLKAAVESGTWATDTSKVVYHDITTGFDPSAHTYDNLHPKAQGELILAGNIARALGIGQRTVGLERKAASALSTQSKFSSDAGTGVSVELSASGSPVGTMTASKTLEGWSINSSGNLLIQTNSNDSDIRFTYSDAVAAHEFTLSLDVRMLATEYSNNVLGIWCGNGVDVGVLYISENGIFWNGTADSNTLFRNYGKEEIFTGEDFSTLSMIWLEADETQGIEAGYYVWLGDQLIGEALSGNTNSNVVSQYKNKILIGDTSGSYVTYAEIANISFDATTAWAPAAIPEPSTFALLTGLGALLSVGTRRRRK